MYELSHATHSASKRRESSACFSAMSHHGFTDQLPRTVFVATDHRVARPERSALGLTFRMVSLFKPRFFGVTQAGIGEQ